MYLGAFFVAMPRLRPRKSPEVDEDRGNRDSVQERAGKSVPLLIVRPKADDTARVEVGDH